jgi:hypothetical protein
MDTIHVVSSNLLSVEAEYNYARILELHKCMALRDTSTYI